MSRDTSDTPTIPRDKHSRDERRKSRRKQTDSIRAGRVDTPVMRIVENDSPEVLLARILTTLEFMRDEMEDLDDEQAEQAEVLNSVERRQASILAALHATKVPQEFFWAIAIMLAVAVTAFGMDVWHRAKYRERLYQKTHPALSTEVAQSSITAPL